MLYIQNTLIFSGTKTWNQIPKEIKKLNYPKFKKELKKLYLLHYANTNQS